MAPAAPVFAAEAAPTGGAANSGRYLQYLRAGLFVKTLSAMPFAVLESSWVCWTAAAPVP